MRAPRTKNGGFTILEVVLAMGILLLGLTSVLALLSFGAALARNAALRTSAAAAVDAVMVDLEESLFPLEADGGVGEPREIVDREVPGHVGVVYSATAVPHPEQVPLPGGPIEYRVDVDISWKVQGAARSRSFTTLLPRQVPFGERLRLQFVSGERGPDNPDAVSLEGEGRRP